MSEFTEIMRQARRMCETFCDACSKCPIGNAKALECGITVTSEMDCKEVERRVMQWAAEHPEPVYPSWKEGWKQLFPEADIRHTFCPEVFGDKYMCDWCLDGNDYNDNCDECLERPMPAEVAEKLGIKPIAPEKPVPQHDGCRGCKWDDKKEWDEPCASCRGTLIGSGEKPDLWEVAENGQ